MYLNFNSAIFYQRVLIRIRPLNKFAMKLCSCLLSVAKMETSWLIHSMTLFNHQTFEHAAPHLAHLGTDIAAMQAMMDKEKEAVFEGGMNAAPVAKVSFSLYVFAVFVKGLGTKVNISANSYIINVMMIKMSAFLIF